MFHKWFLYHVERLFLFWNKIFIIFHFLNYIQYYEMIMCIVYFVLFLTGIIFAWFVLWATYITQREEERGEQVIRINDFMFFYMMMERKQSKVMIYQCEIIHQYQYLHVMKFSHLLLRVLWQSVFFHNYYYYYSVLI